MSARGLVKLAVIGGALYWASRSGYLTQATDAVNDATGLDLPDLSDLFQTHAGTSTAVAVLPSASQDLLADYYDTAEPEPEPAAVAVPTGSGAVSKEEQWLLDHWGDVQPWARRNHVWVAAMMWQESRGNPQATSVDDARGLMQVIPGTQKWMYDIGYRRYPANPGNLYTPNISIYFGTSFLEFLSSKSRDREWITRAYNAGPGGQRSNGSWPAETVDYLAKIKARYRVLMEQKGEA